MRPDSRYTVCGRVEVIVGGSGAGVVDGFRAWVDLVGIRMVAVPEDVLGVIL